jgi:hypothetical protein
VEWRSGFIEGFGRMVAEDVDIYFNGRVKIEKKPLI